MTSKKTRARIANDTVEILKSGRYKKSDGKEVSISTSLKRAKNGTRLYTPDQLDQLVGELTKAGSPVETEFTVENCTTFAAAQKLLEAPEARPLCLNFASAKHPGGGFLSGSQAQEESLARASGLYATINPARRYYDENRDCETSLYTHHMIYSPDVPVFRDDHDEFLESPYLVSFITAPAVNAGAVTQNEPTKTPDIETVMLQRIERVLAIAIENHHQALVLGAWGCGVFRNNPADVAKWFKSVLVSDRRFANRFSQVKFAVLDKEEGNHTYQAFASTFGG